jgi:hypothetical protein
MLCVAFLIAASSKALSAPGQPPSLSPVYRAQLNGEERLDTVPSTNSGPTIAFYALTTNNWPSGLAPLFGVEVGQKWELRRCPARGQENFTEPLFFALPPESEPNVSKISGRWDCRAVSEDGSKTYPNWELCLDRESVAGRFDQNTDYRFAFITGGAFRSDRLDLHVDYIRESYVLTGRWNRGKLKGTWAKADNSDKGTWEAERSESINLRQLERPPGKTLAPLFEWRSTDGRRRWGIDGQSAGWTRSNRPLCRVWVLR